MGWWVNKRGVAGRRRGRENFDWNVNGIKKSKALSLRWVWLHTAGMSAFMRPRHDVGTM